MCVFHVIVMWLSGVECQLQLWDSFCGFLTCYFVLKINIHLFYFNARKYDRMLLTFHEFISVFGLYFGLYFVRLLCTNGIHYYFLVLYFFVLNSSEATLRQMLWSVCAAWGMRCWSAATAARRPTRVSRE